MHSNPIKAKVPPSQLKGYHERFKLLKRAFITLAIVTGSVAMAAIYFVYAAYKHAGQRIWVLSPHGQVYHAASNDQLSPPGRVYEYENHIKLFYAKFYAYDEGSYEQNINDALCLIGESGKQLYQFNVINRVYEKVVQHNMVVQSCVDAIEINMNTIPAQGQVKARQFIQCGDQPVRVQRLDAVFQLRDVARYRKNPHGVRIENFVITDNSFVHATN